MGELFPEDVRRFIDENVESIDQLEILRILWEKPEAEWTEAALAEEVQAQPKDMAASLSALRARGLLRAETRGAATVYRYGPRDAELGAALQRLLEHYRERPVSMIKLVSARAKSPLQTLADAFRIRPQEGG